MHFQTLGPAVFSNYVAGFKVTRKVLGFTVLSSSPASVKVPVCDVKFGAEGVCSELSMNVKH